MEIALYGGKFDPPHIGHLHVALETLRRLPKLDQLWLIPARTHQWRKIVASGDDRFAMLKTFTKYHPKIRVCDIELKQAKPTSTYNTVLELKKKFPKHHFVWILGSDNVPTFHLWDHHKELSGEIRFWIFPRLGYPISKLPKNFSVIPHFRFTSGNFSSSTIRQHLEKKLSIENALTPPVRLYLTGRRLYAS